MLYFDNAATTYPKPEYVYERMDEVNRTLSVNAGRGSYAAARWACTCIGQTKQELLKLVHGEQCADVIFTPSATIALNEIIGGIAQQKDANNANIYLSAYEHNAVARTVYKHFQPEQLNILPIQKNTLEMDLDKIAYDFAQKRPNYVFLSYVSNVTGYILPVQAIAGLARQYEAVVVVDASQALGVVPFDLREIEADFVVFAGHKTLYGPFGIGGFFKRKSAELPVFLAGGTGSDSLNLAMQTKDTKQYEPASENIIAIAGLQAALADLKGTETSYDAAIERRYLQELTLTKKLQSGLQEISGVTTYMCLNKEKHIGIVAFTVSGLRSDEVGQILDADYDIAVRTGYHCAPFIHEYLQDIQSGGVIRASISQFTTEPEIEQFVQAVEEIAEDLGV